MLLVESSMCLLMVHTSIQPWPGCETSMDKYCTVCPSYLHQRYCSVGLSIEEKIPALPRTRKQRKSFILPANGFWWTTSIGCQCSCLPLGTAGQNWYGRVVSTDDERRQVDVKWFVETGRTGVFIISNQEDIVPWKSVLSFARMIRVMGGYRLDENIG